MRGPNTVAAHRALACYHDAPRGDRVHVRVRWWSCPFPVLEREVPLAGRVLEVGCGHGLLSLFLALCSPGRHVVGIDIDRDKLAIARQAAANLVPGEADVAFEAVEPGRLPPGPWDAVVIADVLYLLPADARAELLDACAAALAEGGLLVLKETDRRPRWKGALTVAQELVSTRVLRITEGEQVAFAPPSVFEDRLRAAGLRVASRRVDRGYVHPHHLILARRPFAPDHGTPDGAGGAEAGDGPGGAGPAGSLGTP